MTVEYIEWLFNDFFLVTRICDHNWTRYNLWHFVLSSYINWLRTMSSNLCGNGENYMKMNMREKKNKLCPTKYYNVHTRKLCKKSIFFIKGILSIYLEILYNSNSCTSGAFVLTNESLAIEWLNYPLERFFFLLFRPTFRSNKPVFSSQIAKRKPHLFDCLPSSSATLASEFTSHLIYNLI